MQRYNILWVDDEIDLLKPHILFLENKGYDITTVNNGTDAIEICEHTLFDIIFLDENMPGMSGLEALEKIKVMRPNIPVVMITKSEEEMIMEQAIGAKISDYLIKPLNPNQILLSVKKILDNKRLVTEKTKPGLSAGIFATSAWPTTSVCHTRNGWMCIKNWFSGSWRLITQKKRACRKCLKMQKDEANTNFTRFITDNYQSWLNDPDGDKPVLSHQLMLKKVFPLLKPDVPTFFIVIDNLRYDQWKTIEPTVTEYFNIDEEEAYYSILPTTTAYARNSIFSGMLPSEMEKYHSDIWVGEDDEEGKNNNEFEFLKRPVEEKKPKRKKFLS